MTRPPAYHERVTMRRDCGELTVSVRTNKDVVRVKFTLSTPESVAAAGRYLEYLNAEGG